MDNNVNKILDRHANARKKREAWLTAWQIIKKYVTPIKENPTPESEIHDSTAIFACAQLASGLQSILVNESVDWFSVGLSKEITEENEKISEWMKETERSLKRVFNRPSSNFYCQVHEFFINLVSRGTAVFYICNKPKIYFVNMNVDECALEEDAYGVVTAVFREFKLSYKHAQTVFPNISLFKDEKKENEEVSLLHYTAKTENGCESVYVNLDTSQILLKEELKYFPYLVARWEKRSDNPYGYSPAHVILADIKYLNQLKKLGLQLLQNYIKPAMLAPNRGIELPLNIAPGAVNFYDPDVPNAHVKPLLPIGDWKTTIEEQQITKEAVFKAFFMDLFSIPQGGRMTTAEVSARMEDRLRFIAPMMGRLETEFFNPLILTTYSILEQLGEITALNLGDSMEIEYLSPLLRIQHNNAYTNIEGVIVFLQRSGIGQFMPEIHDNLDYDKLLREFFKIKAIDGVILWDEKEVLALRNKRSQQMQQLQQLKEEGAV